jgi:OmpA-OmpF porin, OOP family
MLQKRLYYCDPFVGTPSNFRKGFSVFIKIALAASFALLSSAAMAADAPHFYAGGDIGTTKGDGDSHRETGYGAFAGYQINAGLAVETGYRRLVDTDQSYEGSNYNVKTDQFSVSVLGSVPVAANTRVFARLGANQVRVKTRGDIAFSDSETRLLMGAGVSYSFSDTVSARLELQRPVKDVLNLSAGVSFRF